MLLAADTIPFQTVEKNDFIPFHVDVAIVFIPVQTVDNQLEIAPMPQL